jgi:histidinol-phosphate aminotransferase
MKDSAVAENPFDSAVRRALTYVTPYIPGKPIAEVQRELGIKNVVKLASNENPLGASPKAMRAYRAAEKDAWLYPEGTSPLLRRALEKHHRLPAGSIVVGNGSDEVMRLLCELLLESGDEAVCSETGFIRFRQSSALMGARVVRVPERDYHHDLRAMAEAVGPRTKLLFIASPNNPTGSYSTADEVEKLLAAVPRRVIVILDEAYYHFARSKPDYPESLPGLAEKHPNLVVLRTFSKAHGLAGLRVGYGAAHPALVSWIDRIRMPFNVALPSQAAAEAALGDDGFVKRSVALVEKERARLFRALFDCGLQVWPSSANFLMAAHHRLAGRELFERLLRKGVIIRPLGEYGLEHHVRISVGSAEQNNVLLDALPKALKR